MLEFTDYNFEINYERGSILHKLGVDIVRDDPVLTQRLLDTINANMLSRYRILTLRGKLIPKPLNLGIKEIVENVGMIEHMKFDNEENLRFLIN
jgi:hypothetical protein